MIPSYVKKYFWDVDTNKLNPNKHPYFVIERILEYGDEKALNWLLKYFKKSQLKQALLKRKNISPRSANYWALIFGIPKNKILCLKKQSQKQLQKTWNY